MTKVSCTLCNWRWVGRDDHEGSGLWDRHMDDAHPDEPGAAVLSLVEVETP